MESTSVAPMGGQTVLPPLGVITVELQPTKCGESSCQEQHPGIKTYMAVITTGPQIKIGFVKLHTIAADGIWQASRVYDDLHFGAQMHKVENFLANESFVTGKDVQVAEAQIFVFVEEVWLVKERRGHGRGLAAVEAALVLLNLPPKKGIVLLQAGSTDDSPFDPFEAGEKLTRHWAKLGFGVWSDSDDSWLCLAFDDEAHGITALNNRAPRKDEES